MPHPSESTNACIYTVQINFDPYVTNYNYYPEFPERNTFKGIFDSELIHQYRALIPKQKNLIYFVVFCLNILMNDFVLKY
ncbi:hypothetical protein BpHYR1_015116 [Brachionus plicatilis]|uniref:Uncharacterized protein n=1 Tax=Brachionus plicatilis TaxID=10195 RepID=A0A3M7S9U0_BRAPC|nr:hypothetical protein BpHYR1_015116 [Brachionus plicatilis]